MEQKRLNNANVLNLIQITHKGSIPAELACQLLSMQPRDSYKIEMVKLWDNSNFS